LFRDFGAGLFLSQNRASATVARLPGMENPRAFIAKM
jgi:hypothetical protein